MFSDVEGFDMKTNASWNPGQIDHLLQLSPSSMLPPFLSFYLPTPLNLNLCGKHLSPSALYTALIFILGGVWGGMCRS